MTISKELFLAILSMDSYNRGYGAGIILDDAVGTKIGAAKIKKTILETSIQGFADDAQAAGFYAIAYDMAGSGIAGLDGDVELGTVISYCGTDTGIAA